MQRDELLQPSLQLRPLDSFMRLLPRNGWIAIMCYLAMGKELVRARSIYALGLETWTIWRGAGWGEGFIDRLRGRCA